MTLICEFSAFGGDLALIAALVAVIWVRWGPVTTVVLAVAPPRTLAA